MLFRIDTKRPSKSLCKKLGQSGREDCIRWFVRIDEAIALENKTYLLDSGIFSAGGSIVKELSELGNIEEFVSFAGRSPFQLFGIVGYVEGKRVRIWVNVNSATASVYGNKKQVEEIVQRISAI